MYGRKAEWRVTGKLGRNPTERRLVIKDLLTNFRYIFVSLIVLVMACGQEQSEMTIQLIGQENSGQTGSATLTAKGAQTEVVIKVPPGPPAGDPQPLHIHFGECGPNLGNRHYNLSDVVVGVSITLIDTSLVSLTQDNNAINLHMSYPEFDIYTSCGNIPGR